MHPAPTPLKYEDLEAAYEWSSSGAPFEYTALLSRSTGEVFLTSLGGDIEEDLPDDIEDGSLYIAVPHRSEFNLGRELAIEFIERASPRHIASVQAYFSRRGAYSRFKALLERESLLEPWYAYEAAATYEALSRWAVENGFSVRAPRRQA
jgi:hypothetical protein